MRNVGSAGFGDFSGSVGAAATAASRGRFARDSTSEKSARTAVSVGRVPKRRCSTGASHTEVIASSRPHPKKVHPIFNDAAGPRVRIALMSFGFKYGVPLDADFVFDMRFLPNPFWIPELRPLTGRDAAVSEFVLRQEGAQDFVDRVVAMLEPVIEGYLREGRRYVTVAVGCTGGKHRSVAVAEALKSRLSSEEVATFVVHRDLGQE